MTRKKRRPVASRSVKVDAVRRTVGQPATTVHVAVERSRLREEVGDDHVKRVVAAFPERQGDAVRWTEEEIQHARQLQGEAPDVEHFSGTHYGPSEPEYGVKVKLETEAGRVPGQAPGESFTIRETSEPNGSHRVRHRR
jgi:hypothetical protein